MSTKKKWYSRPRTHFLTGIIVVAPLFITGWALWWAFNRLDAVLSPFFKRVLSLYIPGTGLITLLLLIWIIGLLANNFIGRQLGRSWNRLVRRIPLINRIYPPLRQLGEVIFFAESRQENFRMAVLVEYPHPGTWAVGFVTQDTGGPVRESLQQDTWSIFLPTTPNPTSGFLLFVPKDKVRPLDIPVAEAINMVISGGFIEPEPQPPVSR